MTTIVLRDASTPEARSIAGSGFGFNIRVNKKCAMATAISEVRTSATMNITRNAGIESFIVPLSIKRIILATIVTTPINPKYMFVACLRIYVRTFSIMVGEYPRACSSSKTPLSTRKYPTCCERFASPSEDSENCRARRNASRATSISCEPVPSAIRAIVC